MSRVFIRYEKEKNKTKRKTFCISIFFNLSIRLRAEHSSGREDREKGNNEQAMRAHHTKRKFQVMEIPAGVRAQPSRPSPTAISLSLSSVTTTSVCTSIHFIETSTRSTLEIRKTANPLPQTKKSPTRGFAPFSNPSAKEKEIAVYNETSEKKSSLRNKRSHAKKETRNMTEDLRHPPGVSPEPRESSTTAGKMTTVKSDLLPMTSYRQK